MATSVPRTVLLGCAIFTSCTLLLKAAGFYQMACVQKVIPRLEQLGPNRLLVRSSAFDANLDNIRIQELLKLCHNGDELMLTRNGVYSGSREQLAAIYVETCYPLEISTSQGARSMGHCSDFIPYIYFANARLSPHFMEATIIQHLSRCSNVSSYLHGEYPIASFFRHARYNYWMPNIEHMKVEQAELVPLTYQFLAKTKVGAVALTSLVDSLNLKDRKIAVKFMSHSSPEPGASCSFGISPDFNRFYQGYGHSGLKHTLELVKCWASRPRWPMLTVVGNKPRSDFEAFRSNNTASHPKNIHIISDRLTIHQICFLQAIHGVHIGPSQREGFGHYLNEGRASGALIVTTNYPPMNEFVKEGVNGVLVDHEPPSFHDWQLLGVGNHFLSNVHVTPEAICQGLEEVLRMSLEERERLGKNSRELYLEDRNIFYRNLEDLNEELLKRRYGSSLPSKEVHQGISDEENRAKSVYAVVQEL